MMELSDPRVEAAARALSEGSHSRCWWDDVSDREKWTYRAMARHALRAAARPLSARDQVELVEDVARATHAHNNSGVGVKVSPLSWSAEQPYMREWHRAMARAALDAIHAFGESVKLLDDDGV